ncbi:MAG: hypothetical protein A2268_14525 [Candidatus Raymondbacteria bacterium RifOxyA12_full_50_37]|uniref:Uncharacterized protein n=1 Tax=Candidatus Raymondbacteria bacterium RIFOXYD12_FULL_49_13 TaxID=1817890 RepID=A0A1F7F2P4_UNCRA|nr:MAG: hypothetical protein A2268_14525 [Candidatus Raymondbacteria bacterium RifOxyA12_full_50_37]OGJ88634.1 MAG: hypothetical protein A2248_20460 [Candidatus Raymondbacteria bacterium RIFOXYA2_FULL_49_16]OGJ90514.1 MAG: hypothetical protein A2350_18690 [Candidatus Raymondbacteria bacterium RifOxyB12_full_50_8]OGK00807.1 MAG: hypothetical protein A2519_07715 [Candidatus Raymondbacteria bacterium RIFOXYD12_FULL_49_13]OGK02890.1 MAG: hypothetical protein A2487_17850 [Candidatus Raymondbacteria 
MINGSLRIVVVLGFAVQICACDFTSLTQLDSAVYFIHKPFVLEILVPEDSFDHYDSVANNLRNKALRLKDLPGLSVEVYSIENAVPPIEGSAVTTCRLLNMSRKVLFEKEGVPDLVTVQKIAKNPFLIKLKKFLLKNDIVILGHCSKDEFKQIKQFKKASADLLDIKMEIINIDLDDDDNTVLRNNLGFKKDDKTLIALLFGRGMVLRAWKNKIPTMDAVCDAASLLNRPVQGEAENIEIQIPRIFMGRFEK